MKRKIWTELLVTIAYITLVGCGSSQPTTAAPAYEEPTDAAAYADEVEEEPVISTEPATTAGLEDVTGENDDFGRPPEDECVAWEEEAEEEVVVAETSEIEGIITLTMYPSHSQLCVVVDAVNPNSGSVQNILSMQITPVIATNEYGYVIFPENPRFGNLQDLFTPDFPQIAVTRVATSNQSMHAGWMDADGNFFDVTAAVGEAETSDFEDPARYQAVGFLDDGKTFVYKKVDDYSIYSF